MAKYHFLFRPVFFIFSLFAGSWLVLKVEQISPSDFGKYKSLFESKEMKEVRKRQLKELIFEFKSGKIDSVAFERKLEEITLIY